VGDMTANEMQHRKTTVMHTGTYPRNRFGNKFQGHCYQKDNFGGVTVSSSTTSVQPPSNQKKPARSLELVGIRREDREVFHYLTSLYPTLFPPAQLRTRQLFKLV